MLIEKKIYTEKEYLHCAKKQHFKNLMNTADFSKWLKNDDKNNNDLKHLA